MSPTTPQAVIAFANAARAFCAWCERTSPDPAPERSVAKWLAQLYACAIGLPEVGPEYSDDFPEIPESATELVQRNVGGFAGRCYRQFFDPDVMLEDEFVVGDLEDDLLDTYKDVKRGLVHFERGEMPNALWHWSFMHRAHWGHHAASAIYALHCKSIATSAQDVP